MRGVVGDVMQKNEWVRPSFIYFQAWRDTCKGPKVAPHFCRTVVVIMTSAGKRPFLKKLKSRQKVD